MEQSELPQRPQRRRRGNGQSGSTPSSAAQQKSLDFQAPQETDAGIAPAHLAQTPTVDVPEGANYEYLDHPADVQLHSWGATLEQALEGVALAMFNYMTPLSAVSVDEDLTREIEAEGHDLHTLLFQFLDEFLFVFASEMFVPCHIKVDRLDKSSWKVNATGRGEKFDKSRHVQGTEVKAITYSAMQVIEEPNKIDIYVIIDI